MDIRAGTQECCRLAYIPRTPPPPHTHTHTCTPLMGPVCSLDHLPEKDFRRNAQPRFTNLDKVREWWQAAGVTHGLSHGPRPAAVRPCSACVRPRPPRMHPCAPVRPAEPGVGGPRGGAGGQEGLHRRPAGAGLVHGQGAGHLPHPRHQAREVSAATCSNTHRRPPSSSTRPAGVYVCEDVFVPPFCECTGVHARTCRARACVPWDVSAQSACVPHVLYARLF